MLQKNPKPPLDAGQFQAFIFDLDGVVTKTAQVHATAWKKLFDRYLEERTKQEGKTFRPFDANLDYRRYVDGKPRYEGVKSFLESRGVTVPYGDPADEPDEDSICGLGNKKSLYFIQALKARDVETFPSTLALIREARAQGIKTAIVSSSKNCAAVLDAAGLTGLFDAKVDGVDLARNHLKGKPEPDMFLQAARLLGVAPERAVIFEDALAGVQAARQGSFGLVVGVNRTDQADSLRLQGADLVVSDLAELTLRNGSLTMSRSIQDLPSALDSSEDIARQARGKSVAVFLDYDGTLTPIVDRPELAVMSQAMRTTVQTLSRHCLVAIVSGRDRVDIERLVNLESLYFAGSHGFEINGPRASQIHHEIGARYLPALDRAEADLRGELRLTSGALVERKKYSVAVHFRLVRDADLKKVDAAVAGVISGRPELRKRDGKKVYEIQPNIEWDKGKAVLWLLEALHLTKDNSFPLYIGDDLTDEDAFQALKDNGIGVVVGRTARPTAAQYTLNNPDDVARFLEQMAAHLETKSS